MLFTGKDGTAWDEVYLSQRGQDTGHIPSVSNRDLYNLNYVTSWILRARKLYLRAEVKLPDLKEVGGMGCGMFGVRKLCLLAETKLLDSKAYLSQYVSLRK